jgi:uncharacterized protein YggE
MKKIYAVLTFSILSFPLFAQSTYSSNTQYIEVYGKATKELKPNELVLSIMISEYKEDREVLSIADIEQNIARGLVNLGMPAENLEISWSSGVKRYRDWKGDYISESRGYKLTIDSIAILNAVLEMLENQKVQSIEIVEINYTDIEEEEEALMVEATQNARKKAENMLAVLDTKLGEVKTIREVKKSNRSTSPVDIYQRSYYGYTGAVSRAVPEPEPIDLSLEKVNLEYEVIVKFGLESL